jgi:hypothetical protein
MSMTLMDTAGMVRTAMLLLVLVAPGEVRAGHGEAASGTAIGTGAPRRSLLHRRSTNPFGSQYFQSASAIPLRRGEGLYRNVLVSWNALSYGITDHFSVAAGLDLYSMLNSRDRAPVWNTRVQVGGSVGGAFHLAGSAMYLSLPLTLPGEEGDTTITTGLTAALAVITYGNPNNQLSLSGGWADDAQGRIQGPLLIAAGAFRLFPNVQAVTENWFFLEGSRTLMANSLGIRVVGEHLAIDVGVLYNEQLAEAVLPLGLPFVGALLNF